MKVAFQSSHIIIKPNAFFHLWRLGDPLEKCGYTLKIFQQSQIPAPWCLQVRLRNLCPLCFDGWRRLQTWHHWLQNDLVAYSSCISVVETWVDLADYGPAQVCSQCKWLIFFTRHHLSWDKSLRTVVTTEQAHVTALLRNKLICNVFKMRLCLHSHWCGNILSLQELIILYVTGREIISSD